MARGPLQGSKKRKATPLTNNTDWLTVNKLFSWLCMYVCVCVCVSVCLCMSVLYKSGPAWKAAIIADAVFPVVKQPWWWWWWHQYRDVWYLLYYTYLPFLFALQHSKQDSDIEFMNAHCYWMNQKLICYYAIHWWRWLYIHRNIWITLKNVG